MSVDNGSALPPAISVSELRRVYDVTAYLVLAHARLVFDGNDSGLGAAERAVRIRLGRA